MPRSIGVAVGIGALFLAGWNSVACSSSASHPGVLSSAGAAASPTIINTGGDGTHLDLGNGGSGNGTSNSPVNGTGNGPSLDDACAAKIITAQAVPLDMYIMLDVSGSMLDLTATQVSKWDAVKLALESFLKDKASAGLGVGLQYFPLQKTSAPTSCTNNGQCGDSAPCFLKFCSTFSEFVPCDANADCLTISGDYFGPCVPVGQCSKDKTYYCSQPGGGDCANNLGACETATASICTNTTSCDIAQYTAPASAIAELPGASAGLVASIDAQEPGGDTPTAPALSGAIAQARAWATAHADHRVVAVLATDGLPTECTPDAITDVAALAKGGVTGNPSINTFVIGVFGDADIANGAPTNLDSIAQQGGTNKAFIVDTQQDVTMQFQNALDSIRGARLACQFQLPQAPTGGTLNYKQVNVGLTNGAQTDYIYYVTKVAACDASTGGWYYDVEPSVGTPTKIIACPTTCNAFQAAPNGASVGIALDCDTIVK